MANNISAKNYLSQAYRIDRRIDSKLEQVQSLRELAGKAAATLSDMPRNPSRDVHRMEDVICKMMDLKSEINADIDRLMETKRKVMAIIKKVESPELQMVLELRYLCFKPWEEIADELGYSEQHVFRLHGAALNAVTEKLRVNVIE
jgi:DNA-directed RNA polymerase specialized sigma subunit